jgi:hypothetical protein
MAIFRKSARRENKVNSDQQENAYMKKPIDDQAFLTL